MPSYPLPPHHSSSQPPPATGEGAAHWQHMKSYKTSNKAWGKRKIKNTKKIQKNTHTPVLEEEEDVRRRGKERKRFKTVMTERRLINQWWEMLSGAALELNVRAGQWAELPVIFLIKVIHGAAAPHVLTLRMHTHKHTRTRTRGHSLGGSLMCCYCCLELSDLQCDLVTPL